MENNILNNLQLYRGKWFSDLVDMNQIFNASQEKPYEVSQVLSIVFGTKDGGYSTSLDMLTGGLGNVMTIDKDVFEWNVIIDADRAVTIRDAKAGGSATSVKEGDMAGLNNTPILLWLNF